MIMVWFGAYAKGGRVVRLRAVCAWRKPQLQVDKTTPAQAGVVLCVGYLVRIRYLLSKLLLESISDKPIHGYALWHSPVVCQFFKQRMVLKQDVKILSLPALVGSFQLGFFPL